ncbi:PTGS2 [Mytilus coruscus]|uniref:PTGS2 n=1 Tax=Mytilus coruscus TaxID=42192 RepID=A0A6J8ATH3_MYTCO|nr:PTGS2 [Mytilus coruscus]
MKIVTEEYIQHLSNYHYQILYKPELLFDVPFQYQNRIALEFNHLYHWHPLIPDDFRFGGTNYTLKHLLGNPEIVIKHGMASFVDSLSKQIAGRFTVKNHPHFGVKVAKNVIKHGRELRLQSYNNYRKRFNLQPFQSFEQLTGNKKLAKELETLYGDINGVEFYVGLLSEKLRPKAMFSETMMELGSPFSLKGLMSNPLSSPKYWKPSTFGGAVGFDLVNSATLKKLFCQNINGDCPEVSFRVPGFVESQGEADDESFRNCPEHGEL